MSFDPITLALAKEYTDEKVGEGGGGVVAINLDRHGISAALLNLFAQGGGDTTLEDVTHEALGINFWDSASAAAASDIALTMVVENSTMIIRGITMVVNNYDGQCTSMSFSFLISSYETTYMLNAQIVRHDSGGASIYLKVS